MMDLDLLNAKTLPGTFGEADKIVVQREVLLGRLDPAIGVELVRFWKQRRVCVHEICRLAYWVLQSC